MQQMGAQMWAPSQEGQFLYAKGLPHFRDRQNPQLLSPIMSTQTPDHPHMADNGHLSRKYNLTAESPVRTILMFWRACVKRGGGRGEDFQAVF